MLNLAITKVTVATTLITLYMYIVIMYQVVRIRIYTNIHCHTMGSSEVPLRSFRGKREHKLVQDLLLVESIKQRVSHHQIVSLINTIQGARTAISIEIMHYQTNCYLHIISLSI